LDARARQHHGEFLSTDPAGYDARTVTPTRRPNAELRTREHLTPGEVDALIEAVKSTLATAEIPAPG
jgi:hypothetical protein